MDRFKLSVIIPVYNSEEYLAHTILNLRRQTFENFEVIFVDDCSRDNSAEIIKNAMEIDSRINLVRHSKNCGCAVARNTGVSVAEGKYILFLDSDDDISDCYLETMYNVIMNYNVDVAVCKSTIINKVDSSSRYFGQWNRLQQVFDKIDSDVFTITEPYGYPDIWNLIDYVAWNKIMTKEFFLTYNLWFPELKYYEDIPFAFLSCLYSVKIAFINVPLINYYIQQSPNSMTSWKIPKEYLMMDAFDLIIEKAVQEGWKEVYIGCINRVLSNMYAVINNPNTSEQEKENIKNSFAKKYKIKWNINSLLCNNKLTDAARLFVTDVVDC